MNCPYCKEELNIVEADYPASDEATAEIRLIQYGACQKCHHVFQWAVMYSKIKTIMFCEVE